MVFTYMIYTSAPEWCFAPRGDIPWLVQGMSRMLLENKGLDCAFVN